MFKKSFLLVLISFSICLFHDAFTMESIGVDYGLSVKKLQNQEDVFKIKLDKKALFADATQTCSLIANFDKQMITDEYNLFAPFQISKKFQHTTFANPSYPDCFLWQIPDFGLLKLHRDGSVFFGHSADEAPLTYNELTLDSSGKLFLETLKATALHIKSKEAQLCETVVTDRLHADHTVLNSGGLKIKQLLGQGNFTNEGIVEFDGTQQDPALLGIKTFQNKKNKESVLDAKVTGADVRLTSDNQTFQNKKNGLCEIAQFTIDKAQQNTKSTFSNKGSLKTDQFDLSREAINEGFLQAHSMNVKEQQLTNKEFGQVKVLDNLIVESSILNDGSVEVNGNTTLNIRTINELKGALKGIETSGKVIALCDAISLNLQDDIEFHDIKHLELYAKGPCTILGSLKAPTLTLHVNGPLIGGKDNDHLGTIAATDGPLTVKAHGIDGRYAKFYSNGDSLLESTQSDIVIGAEARGVDENIKQQFEESYPGLSRGGKWKVARDKVLARFDYILDVPNGAYAACNSHLTLKSAANIFVRFGSVLSMLGNTLIAQKEIENLSGKVSSHGPICIQSDTYTHGRKDGATVWTINPNPNHCSWQYPRSGPAQLESLDKIDFKVNKIKNVAGSMRSGKGLFVNGNALEKGAVYVEEPQTFYFTCYCNTGWSNTAILNQSCITQAADEIKMNLGDFVITGNMHTGKINIHGNTGLFANNNRTRQTLNPTQPGVVDVTAGYYDEAQKPGIYRIGADNSIETEFSFGHPSRPQEGDQVWFKNQILTMPFNLKDIKNPLSGINLDLFLQQQISNLAGKVYLGNAKGNNLATVLWANANQWRQEHGKEVMSQEELQNLKRSMLLSQIVFHGVTPLQHLLLCIAPNDINPYRDQGDLVADTVQLHTVGDQTHHNNRIVANGPEGISITSDTGDANFETQSYTVSSETRERKEIQQIAMPQQQLIAQAGPINVTAHNNLNRTGTLIAAAGDVNEHAEIGSVKKNPLILQTMVETRTEESDGWFSSTETVQTSLTHQVLPSTTISGTTLHDKAGTTIHAVASQDSAGKEIIYESPSTNIEGIILANRNTTKSNTSSAFSEQSQYESKETPYAMPAHIQAPLIQFVGDRARINANIYGKELHDNTEQGAEFVAKVAQMLSSGQTLVDSPFMSVDAGYKAMHETMIPPMLMVEKIVRAKDTGHMLFESAIIDKDRTEIIGTFVETTYQLKQWQTSWCHKSQLIPDEALVVVAAAITFYTGGMGVELLAGIIESITVATGMQLSAAGIAMVNAGVATICTSAGTFILRTGDPIQTVQQLGSPAQLKSIAFSMASAGLCAELGNLLDINMKPEFKSLTDHVTEHALRSIVDPLLNITINQMPFDKAIAGEFTQVPLKAVAAYVANKIGDACMDAISRKTAHAVLGGVSGFAMQHNRDGIISGAVGALTAETVGDILISDAQEICAIARARLLKSGKPVTIATMQQAINAEVRAKTDLAKIAAGAVAVLTHQNPSIALATASNAIDNDVAIRGTLYALAEFQAMVTAASQAFVTLHSSYEETFEKQYTDLQESAHANEDKAERKPFVKDPESGVWFTACISDDLVLTKGVAKGLYVLQRMRWHKHPQCPFTVNAHGDATSVALENKNIHPEALADYKMDELQKEGHVQLNYYELANLIRSAPNYKEGQHIHLFSCECGAHQEGIAQKLADEMNVSVSAFTGLAGINAVMFASIASDDDKWIPSFKEIKTFYPRYMY